MWSRKLSPSALYWFNRSWQTCVWYTFISCVRIYRTNLAETLQYFNVATIIYNTLKPIFSSVHSSLVVICWFVCWADWDHFMLWHLCVVMWLFFHTAVVSIEIHYLQPHCAHICCLGSINIQEVSNDCNFFSVVICLMATKCNGILMGRFNLES